MTDILNTGSADSTFNLEGTFSPMALDHQNSNDNTIGPSLLGQLQDPHSPQIEPVFPLNFDLGCIEKEPTSENSNHRSLESSTLVGLEGITKQLSQKIAREGCHFNIILAGDQGLGKTTLINTLFEPFEQGSPEEDQLDDNTEKFQFHSSTYTDKSFKLKLTIIDTPGFFDTNNNKFTWVPIANYIDEQLRLLCFQEEQPERTNLKDERVHACIYFIQPTYNGLTESDVNAMKNLCTRLNLIPVISKADSYTKEQIAKYKKLAKASMEKNEIFICGDPVTDITEEVPYAIIGASTYVENNKGEKVRGRAYNWGVAEVENDSHCEFNRLKEMLLSSFTTKLIDKTEKHYENYRKILMELRLLQFLKLENEGENESGEDLYKDLNDTAVEKIRFQEEQEFLEKALKNSSSLEICKPISKISLEKIQDLLVEQDPVYLESQQQIKKNFATIVSAQEQKFKEWKSALVAKQRAFNKEIQNYHKIIGKLQNEIEELEEPVEEEGANYESHSHEELSEKNQP